jgi:hypothetical protein
MMQVLNGIISRRFLISRLNLMLTPGKFKFLIELQQGTFRLHDIRRLIGGGAPTLALTRALFWVAQRNQLGAARMLIEAGAEVKRKSLWLLVAREGFAGMLALFMEEAWDPLTLQECFQAAAISGRSAVLDLLISSAGDVAAPHFPSAVRAALTLGHLGALDSLLRAGAPPPEDALPLAVRTNRGDLVRLLLAYGVDACEDAFRAAVGRCNVSVAVLLVNNGADIDSVRQGPRPRDPDLIRLVAEKTRRRRLAAEVHCSFLRLQFRWQLLAGVTQLSSTGLRRLRRQAAIFNVDGSALGRRRTCAALAAICYGDGDGLAGCDQYCDQHDLSGTPISDLAPWQRFRDGDRWYNIFDLRSLFDMGRPFDPYTTRPLPETRVKERLAFLKSVLLSAAWRQRDILCAVRAAPLPSVQSRLRELVTSELWPLLTYPPSVEFIVSLSDDKMREVLGKFTLLLLSNSFCDAGVGETAAQVARSTGWGARFGLVDLFLRFVRLGDEWQSTRCQMVSILLRHCAGVATDGGEEDLFSFIVSPDPDPSPFDHQDDEDVWWDGL